MKHIASISAVMLLASIPRLTVGVETCANGPRNLHFKRGILRRTALAAYGCWDTVDGRRREFPSRSMCPFRNQVSTS